MSVTKDKVFLLMEETGCERGEAELALELASYDLGKAIRTIASLLKNIVVLKAKFRSSENSLFGLFISILNKKTQELQRLRAVVSYNPSVYLADLNLEWYEFEKHLYACRLWEGSLQGLTQQVERFLCAQTNSEGAAALFAHLKEDAAHLVEEFWLGRLGQAFEKGTFQLSLQKQELDLSQYHAMRRSIEDGAHPLEPSIDAAEPIRLRIALEGDPGGCEAGSLQPGDVVHAQVIDGRDIAQYLARLFGGRTREGLRPFTVPVESVRASGQEFFIRVRFSPGIMGEVGLPPDLRVRSDRMRSQLQSPWWRRWW